MRETKVGVACFIFKEGKFLMGQRKSTHGYNTWSIPGGHLEFGETFEEAAQREVLEETGLEVKNIRFGAITNDHFPQSNKHYISIWMISDFAGGREKLTEPDKYINHGWYSFDKLPSPLFLSWNQLLKSEFINKIKEYSNKSKAPK